MTKSHFFWALFLMVALILTAGCGKKAPPSLPKADQALSSEKTPVGMISGSPEEDAPGVRYCTFL